MAGRFGEIRGLDALQARLTLSDAPDVLQETVREEAEAVAEAGRQRLRAEHPRGTGALAESVAVSVEGEGDAAKAYVGTASPVGRYLEYGTRHSAAAPWLIPSLHARSSNIKRSFERIVKRISGRFGPV
ncbi:HK97 gp10 family phage protein [Methyloligella sp. 2.7D]|uniref:HK97 gp10 family phage protein n=1 Tax=unclassified Methyloligella TaxID=2625955 RepID=UPI00157C52CE|nr:HK97 gp10 family phage protein [Methyloligella sp. GL2]QKP77114.1 HK97 gp10 family phage protein [Methyloligella sp. GL2]